MAVVRPWGRPQKPCKFFFGEMLSETAK